MRVAVILEQALNRVPGGTGRSAREMTAALARTASPTASVETWTAWHCDVLPARVPGAAGPRRLPLPRRTLTLAWERGYGPVPRSADVVHAPTLLAPPRRGRPLVVTIHDAVPWTHPETLTPRGVAWHRRMAARVTRTADAVVVPSRATAVELAARLPLGDRLRVVPPGITPALNTPRADGEATAVRLALPTAYLLTLATLEPRKGLDLALAALAHPDAPDLPLLVVGRPGWGGVDPHAESERRGLAPGRVRLLGHLPDADLAVALSRAAALVAPSRAEGFGLPVLEAMAAAVPVVCSNIPAFLEVGADAVLATPVGDVPALAAALHAVVTDAAVRDRLTAAGPARAARFSWERSADELWRLYDALAR